MFTVSGRRERADSAQLCAIAAGKRHRYRAERGRRRRLAAGVTSAMPASEERPLVGRDRELAELQGLLARAATGRGASCLITGEPGIGKTSLATMFAEDADDRALVLWGSCWPRGAAPAYWPWTQALRQLVQARSPQAVRDAIGPDEAQIARVVPELRAAGTEAEAPGADETSRFALFDAIARLLGQAARERPLVVVIDDVHDADAPSIALLEFAARTLATAPVLLLATAREHEAALRDDLATPLARIGPNTRELALRGLEREEIAAMVRRHGPVSDPTPLAAALHERTNGNPFFVDRLLALVDADDAAAAGMALPTGVREAIRRRLEPLGPRAMAMLGVGAVIGHEPTVATLALASERTGAEVLADLDQPRALGVLVEVRDAREPTLRFTHALVRDTVYEDLPAVRRAELHRAVAQALEHRAAGAAAPTLAEIAHHYVRAEPVTGPEPARDYAAAAAEQAMALSAWEEAVGHLEVALRMQELIGHDDERRCDLLLALGRAHTRAGDLEAARGELMETIALARRLRAARRMALAAVELGAVGLPPGDVDEEIVAALEEALERLDDRPTLLRARVLARLAVQLYWADGATRREGLVAEARAIVAGVDDPPSALDILTQLHLATAGPESPERLRSLEHLLGLANHVGAAETAAQLRVWRVAAHLQLGDLRAAAADVEAFARLSARLAQPRWEWYLPLLRGLLALIEGRFEDAERLRNEAGEIGLPIHGSMAPLLLGTMLVASRWTERQLGDLVDPITALVDAHPAQPAWRTVRVAALVDAGRRDEARAEAGALVRDGELTLPVDTTWLSSTAMLADAVARLGDAAAARVLYAALEPFADHNATLPSGAFIGPVQRHLGALAIAMGEPDRALRHLAAARDVAQACRMRAMLAWIKLDEAAALLARGGDGDAGRARAALVAGRELAADLGMAGVVELADARLEDMTPTPAPEPERASAGAATDALLRRDGDTWTVAVGERSLTVRHSKGLEQLAVLLEHPGVEVHAIDLVHGGAAARGAGDPGGELNVRSAPDEDLGPALDTEAKAAYRERVTELREEIEEAESFHDPERASRARAELDFIAAELGRAVGLGGRDRRQGSDAERARVNVTRSIRSVLKRIADHDPLLAQELIATVRTGTFCVYEPDPRRPLRWRVQAR
jgi:tetratricopeptide (TPR) repeat protein